MHFRKLIGTFVTTVVACLAMTAPSQAQFDPMVDFHTPGAGPAISFSSNGTGGGVLVTNAGGTLIDIDGGPFGTTYAGPAYLTFGPLQQITGSGVLHASGKTTALFGAGTFEIWTGTNGTGQKLLGGSFGVSEFEGRNRADLAIDFGQILYDKNTVFGQQFLAQNWGTSIIGNLSLSLSSISPSPLGVYSDGGLKDFTARGFVGTMDAMAVPEPGEYAIMGMSGLTVCGLMIRARRRRTGSSSLS